MNKLVILVALMMCSFLLHAQKNYAVMIADSKTGNPIKGAAIKIISTGITVNTSESGNAVILALPDDSLHIQSKGYKDRAISMVNQGIAISIMMEPKKVKAPVAKKPGKRH
jgi:hypothetical protein